MGVEFKKTSHEGKFSPFWRQEVRMLPGGFEPIQTFPAGMVILAGTPLAVDFDNMKAAVVKVGKVITGGTTTNPRVSKRNNFVVGDVVMKIGKTDFSTTVKTIDRSNSEYDVIGLTAAITGLAAGDFIQEVTAYEAAVTGDRKSDE